MTKPGIEISVIYNDVHLVELRVRASNGIFSGQADAYGNHGELAELANTLMGFPGSTTDVRIFEIGTFDDKYAGGGASFRFFASIPVGHAMVEVKLKADTLPRYKLQDTVAFHIPVEAAAIDAFVDDLNRISDSVGNSAFLRACE